MRGNTQRLRRAVLVALTGASPLLLVQPALAGSWTLTGTPTGSYTINPATSGSGGAAPSFTPSSMTLSGGAGGGGAMSISGSFAYTGTVRWVPNGTLQQDPAPATVTITESSVVQVTAQYSLPLAASASDGLGDAAVTAPGARGGQSTTSSGTRTTTVAVPAGGSYQLSRAFSSFIQIPGASCSSTINYSVSVH